MADSILEKIAANIASELGQISVGNGHSFTARVERYKQRGNPPRNSLVVVEQADPEEDTTAPTGRKAWQQRFFLTAFFRESENTGTPIDKVINNARADIEKKLCEDRNRGGLAIDTIIRAPQSIQTPNGDFEGITVVCDVHYRTLENDPFTQ
jgi:hypothetical protein